RQKGTTVDLIYHGTPAQAHFREDSVIDQMMQLADEGAIRKLGFVKGGLCEFFRGLGYRAEFVMNFVRMPLLPTNSRPGPDGRLHIGVFAPNISHKNVETQILAALMIPDAVVHVCEMPPMVYLRRRDRIVVHGIRPHAEFIKLLATMHATLYVSLVECYPMTVLESLAMGVVCLTSHSSMLFDSAPDLFRELVVTDHDNPHAIARKLSAALDRRAELVPRAQEHLGRLNALAERRWQEFLAE
ncbi:MAG TPA: glycosyltransferase, partial [Archangium sp.]|nr:glycosyltransferase [Archangium sp.]